MVWERPAINPPIFIRALNLSITCMVLFLQHGCVVSGSMDGMVKVWSHRGSEITTLRNHTQCVNAVDMFVKLKIKEGKISTKW